MSTEEVAQMTLVTEVNEQRGVDGGGDGIGIGKPWTKNQVSMDNSLT